MSELRVDKIVSSSGSGSVEFTHGINLPEGAVISGIAQTAQSLTPNSNVNTSGIITATGFDGDLTGNADTATALETSRDFSISGDATASAVSFDGTTNVGLALTLADTTVSAGSYGSSTEIPTFTVDSKGRLTTAGTTFVGTALTVSSSGGFVAGIATVTELHLGNEGFAIQVKSDRITGPSSIVIDPAAVGDDTGLVIIKGDLQVDGTQTIINSTTVTVEDKNIQIADGATNDAAADGAGITVNSGDGNKTFQFSDTNDSFQANIALDVTSGNVYKVNGTEVLSADTLGSGVVNSSLTSVGTLGQLEVTGVTTSTDGFDGDLTGDVTGNADTATALKTSRDFSISGDLVSNTISFDGGGNVSFASTLSNSFNANTSGIITASAFVGDGSGLTGAGSTVFNNTTTNQEFYLTFTDITSGTLTSTGISTSKLTYNPFSGEVTAVNYNSTSDQSLKTNIQTVDHALDIVNNLRGVSFDWKETYKSSYGVIAQELEQVLPDLVGNDDIKTVNYNGIIGILIEAIKELKNEIDILKSIVVL